MWRIVSKGRIAFGVGDDGQMFGLSAPIKGEDRTRFLLGNKKVVCASVDPTTADIVVGFEDGTRLDVFALSMGYEAWQAFFRHGDDEIMLIGGGGTLSFICTPIGDHPRVVVGRPLADWVAM